METKTNIAELLKDCPRGMELYSPMCGKCVFDRLNMGTIICKKQNTQEITFTSEGYYMLPVFNDCECMIFPSKDQRDWSKFQRPFKDGDIITCGYIYENKDYIYTGILAREVTLIRGKYFVCDYCSVGSDGFFSDGEGYCDEVKWIRLATEEEKQKLFDAIKANGYKWNAETKTLEKIEIESRCTYKEFIHYLADKAIGDKREVIKAFNNNEHNRFIGYLQVTKRLINSKLFILFKVDGRELEAEWQASKNYGVWQERGWGGESYSGYLLFPTYKDNEYFVLWYKC